MLCLHAHTSTQPTLWDVTGHQLTPHKHLWTLLPPSSLRTLRTLTHAADVNLTIILSEPMVSSKAQSSAKLHALQRFVAPIRPRASDDVTTLFRSAHGLAYVLGTTLVGAHTNTKELAALGQVNSVLGVITNQWLPLTFSQHRDDAQVVPGYAQHW